jgi:hypothetical protein
LDFVREWAKTFTDDEFRIKQLMDQVLRVVKSKANKIKGAHDTMREAMIVMESERDAAYAENRRYEELHEAATIDRDNANYRSTQAERERDVARAENAALHSLCRAWGCDEAWGADFPEPSTYTRLYEAAMDVARAALAMETAKLDLTSDGVIQRGKEMAAVVSRFREQEKLCEQEKHR